MNKFYLLIIVIIILVVWYVYYNKEHFAPAKPKQPVKSSPPQSTNKLPSINTGLGLYSALAI